MTSMQHYMDDIHDLLDGLNEEMSKRMRKIGIWDARIAELSDEAISIENFVVDTSNCIEERKEKLNRLTELKTKIRDLAEKKCLLTERNQKTVTAVYGKLSELAYHCKCEVEIDNPGCTEQRERMFCQSFIVGNRNRAQPSTQETQQSIPIPRRTREMSSMTDDSTRSGTPVPGKDKTKKRGVGRPRNRDYKEKFQTSAFSSARSSVERAAGVQKKTQSKYMRKKEEKLREEEEKNRLKAFDVKKEMDDFDPFGLSQWDISEDTIGKADLGPEDERELLDCLMHDFEGLNSPPKSLMEALDVTETGLYSMDMYPSANKEGSSETRSNGDFAQPLGMASYSTNFKTNAATSSSSSESVEKRKRNMLFGSIPETSFSGRPRKLTDRVTEMLICHRQKEERHQKMKYEWCICGGLNTDSDMMVKCDNENCRHKWFHFTCVGLTAAPDENDEWYCSECRRQPHH